MQLQIFTQLGNNFLAISWQMVVMWVIGAILIFLAIKKEMEPTLLLPMGFGAILVNLPFSGAINQLVNTGLTEAEFLAEKIAEKGGIAETIGGYIVNDNGIVETISQHGPLTVLFEAGVANELFPLILFIGIGAMIDFGPLLSNPKLLLFGAAAQFGIFMTLSLARLFGYDLIDAASIAIIGAADGPTSIFVAQTLGSKYLGAIMVAAYSYMALVPIVQPPIIKALTTKKERMIKMPYEQGNVSKLTRILFPVVVTLIVGIAAPTAAALVGFLMFGNLIRECGVLDSLSQTAQNVLANLVTIFLGITVASQMKADQFVAVDTILILFLGLLAFVFDTAGGVIFAKIINLFSKKKINPMIGAAGISAFPMSARIVHKMALKEDPQNFILMHSIGVNVSGQIASVVAGGLILTLVKDLL